MVQGSLVLEENEEKLVRSVGQYSFSGKKKLSVTSYQHNLQYVHVYTARLAALRPRVRKAMHDKISEDFLNASTTSEGGLNNSSSSSPRKYPSPAKSAAAGDGKVSLVPISGIRPDRKLAVIGTLQKRQSLKPSILKEVSEEHNLEPAEFRSSFVHDSDQLYIEDETQSLALSGNIDTQRMVVGLIGQENDQGEFEVTELFYPHLDIRETPLALQDGGNESSSSSSSRKDEFVMFVSGLNVGASYETVLLDLIAAFVAGDCGPMVEIASKIIRVIVCGDSLDDKSVDKSLHSQARYLSKKSSVGSVLPLKTLDAVFEQIAATCDLDLMPGENDPSTAFMPQQPMHRCMFPKARKFTSFHTVTNPYEFTLNGHNIIGCSGQNLKDIARYSTETNDLKALEMTLKCQVTCPTAPDTLPCYPLSKREDPFVINSQPSIYFAGNTSSLQFEKVNDDKQLLLCVPTFSETKQVVLVNLKNLQVVPVCFSDHVLLA